MRVIGLDVHRNFAQVAFLENGLMKDHGRFAMARDAVPIFCRYGAAQGRAQATLCKSSRSNARSPAVRCSRILSAAMIFSVELRTSSAPSEVV